MIPSWTYLELCASCWWCNMFKTQRWNSGLTTPKEPRFFKENLTVSKHRGAPAPQLQHRSCWKGTWAFKPEVLKPEAGKGSNRTRTIYTDILFLEFAKPSLRDAKRQEHGRQHEQRQPPACMDKNSARWIWQSPEVAGSKRKPGYQNIPIQIHGSIATSPKLKALQKNPWEFGQVCTKDSIPSSDQQKQIPVYQIRLNEPGT